MISKNLADYARQEAQESGLDFALICGFIMQESSGDIKAMRYEKDYRYLWDVNANKPFQAVLSRDIDGMPINFKGLPLVTQPKAEWFGQKTSWGPMQIIGAVARELGFKDRFEALQGNLGLSYSIKHLEGLHKRFFAKYGIDGVIAAYNCGQPKPEIVPGYVQGVLNYAQNHQKYLGG